MKQKDIYSVFHSVTDATFGTNTIFGYEKDPTLFATKKYLYVFLQIWFYFLAN